MGPRIKILWGLSKYSMFQVKHHLCTLRSLWSILTGSWVRGCGIWILIHIFLDLHSFFADPNPPVSLDANPNPAAFLMRMLTRIQIIKLSKIYLMKTESGVPLLPSSIPWLSLSSPWPQTRPCYRCGAVGHLVSSCPNPPAQRGRGRGGRGDSRWRGRPRTSKQ